MINYRWSGATDVGRLRLRNEDAVLPNDVGLGPGPVVVAVADGLGGHPGGDIASRLAVSAVSIGTLDAGPEALVDAAHVRLRNRISELIGDHPEMVAMATTLTLAILHPGGRIEIGHVGDSRAYVSDGRLLAQLTNDHTVAMDLVREGALTEGEAEQHAGWHVMSNWLGWDDCRVETHELELRPSERLLLCSDGLTNMVPHDEVRSLLFDGTAEEACQRLVAAANEAGGADNISVVVVEVVE